MSVNISTISELRRTLTNEISAIFSTGEAQSVSRLILEHFGIPQIEIVKDPSALIDNKIQAEIRKIVKELHNNRPIQYILGETEFYGLTLKVNESVLIPRSETEELVEMVTGENSIDYPTVLDIGTGSGCIAIALAKHIEGSRVMAIDIDPKALELARENAVSNQVEIEFIHQSLFGFSLPEGIKKVDILVSNPPYVTQAEKKLMQPNVLEHEPGVALFVPDNDPLLFYREIIRLAKDGLAANGMIWLEINEALGKKTRTLFLENGYNAVAILKDIHGKDRFIKASQ